MNKFGLGKLGQIAIHVVDLDTCVAFYRDTLGLTFLFQAGQLAFFDLNGVRLMLSSLEEPEQFKAAVLYHEVDDIDATYAAMIAAGIAFDEAPHFIAKMGEQEVHMGFFRDPERNLIAIMGYK